jgi:hypothetical protein
MMPNVRGYLKKNALRILFFYFFSFIFFNNIRLNKTFKDSRARVDVHRREGPGSDKVATIFGAPEAGGAAAVRILEIVRKEDKDISLPLRILAHNALIGRLIGRDGRNLKLIQV